LIVFTGLAGSKLDEPFKLEMDVKGRGPQKATFKVTQGKCS